jgi:hypothetical protein
VATIFFTTYALNNKIKKFNRDHNRMYNSEVL